MPPVSKIARLPQEIQDAMRTALAERGYGDIQGVTDQVNAMLEAAGLDITIGKSAVGEESKRLKRAQAAIRATTEAAKLIAEASADQADHRSEAVMALVQSETFEVMLQIQEAADQSDPVEKLKTMAKVAEAISSLSRARVNQAKWRADVEAQVKAAAEKVAKIAQKGGASAATIAEIKESILGINRRLPHNQAGQQGGAA